MAKIKISSKLLEALPDEHKEHCRSILLEAGVLKAHDELEFDPAAEPFPVQRPERTKGWGPDDPHHIACVDGCYAMFELAYNACMSQGGAQIACGQAAGQVFDACVTNMCGAELDNK